ncbi:endo-1,4-beta-xylanase [Carboxylicivirga marina]|uniref:Beta-xylanase n=1 Tax=Carboxylicivirga marina TaxID=2800988 RepID=A0ABS1HEK1_9BACT|nr:endo-1,4-beta-xylanase [Carboxylicivirga marina]MBK3516074.1 endo-1,4-beta-xylanase [Carboxylicivirga marina]
MRELAVIFLALLMVSCQPKDKLEKGLADSYKDHFMIGTLYHGEVLGNDIVNPYLEEEYAITEREFNVITAENCMKPMHIIGEKGEYNFDEADRFVKYASDKGLTIVGHTLVWKNSAPDWFFKNENGDAVSRDVLIARMTEYIDTVVSRYKGKIAYWDVVNEAVDVFPDGKGGRVAKLKSTPWYDIIGDDYIEIAYRTAHKADPSCKLLYNDYNMYNKEKTDFIVNMVNDFKSKGVPIHGIGSQAHMFIEHPKLDQIEYWLRKCADKQIPLHVTEMDISVLPNAWKHRGASVEDNFELAEEFNPYSEGISHDLLEQQAKRYADVFSLFLKYSENVERVTLWGVWDGNSWRNYHPMKGRTDYPLLFDRNFQKKPAYEALQKLID